MVHQDFDSENNHVDFLIPLLFLQILKFKLSCTHNFYKMQAAAAEPPPLYRNQEPKCNTLDFNCQKLRLISYQNLL
jgi:hypothetical protein